MTADLHVNDQSCMTRTFTILGLEFRIALYKSLNDSILGVFILSAYCISQRSINPKEIISLNVFNFQHIHWYVLVIDVNWVDLTWMQALPFTYFSHGHAKNVPGLRVHRFKLIADKALVPEGGTHPKSI